MGKRKKGTSRKKNSGAAALGLLPCLPGPNAVAVGAPGTPSNSTGQGAAANKDLGARVGATRVDEKRERDNYA